MQTSMISGANNNKLVNCTDTAWRALLSWGGIGIELHSQESAR